MVVGDDDDGRNSWWNERYCCALFDTIVESDTDIVDIIKVMMMMTTVLTTLTGIIMILGRVGRWVLETTMMRYWWRVMTFVPYWSGTVGGGVMLICGGGINGWASSPSGSIQITGQRTNGIRYSIIRAILVSYSEAGAIRWRLNCSGAVSLLNSVVFQ